MTAAEFRESTGLSSAELIHWVNQGLVVPERTGAGSRNPEFHTAQQTAIRTLVGG